MVVLLRRAALRTAWLMVGAAIGLAAGLLLGSLAEVTARALTAGRVLIALPFVLPVALLGLLPGVRELEVTAARTLLDVRGELVQPTRPTAGHRYRSMVTVLLHLVGGLVAATLLVGVLPSGFVIMVASLRGRATQLADWTVAPGPIAGAMIGVGLVVGSLLATAGLGRLSAMAIGRLLGPTAEDRLAVALVRLEAESGHTRLARELHDGIGHALTIIGLQAAAGRRVLTTDPDRADGALGTIESTARGALAELDNMLGTLRSGLVDRRTDAGLDRLDALITTYRGSGMTITSDVESLPWLSPPVSRTAYAVVAEGLTNAARHAAPGLVALRVRSNADTIEVMITSPLPAGSAALVPSQRGLGLTGIAERVRLFGGTTDAGPDGPAWVLTAVLPRNVGRG